MRLTSKGKPDKSFGSDKDGMATAPTGDIGHSVAVEADGDILVGSSDQNQNGRPMSVARFDSSGVLDRSFGTAGIAETLFWDPDLTSSVGVSGLEPTDDGGVVGYSHLDYIGGDGHGSAGVFRMTSDGQLNSAFGTSGHTEVAFGNSSGGFAQWFPCAFGADSQGRFTVTGDGSTGTGNQFLTTRLTAAGQPDPTFGTSGDGRAITPGSPSSNLTTCGATVTAAGILTTGVGRTLAQLNTAGAPNTSFGRGGLVQVAEPKGVAINAVARAPKRRIVVAGSAKKAIYVGRYRLPASS